MSSLQRVAYMSDSEDADDNRSGDTTKPVVVDVRGFSASPATQGNGKKGNNPGQSDSVTSLASTGESPWTCVKCQKTFTKAKCSVMECDYCREHTCTKCAKITAAEYKTMKREDLFWCCRTCTPKMMRLLQSLEDTEGVDEGNKDCNTTQTVVPRLLEEIDKKFKMIESKIDEKLSKYSEGMPETIKKSWADVAAENIPRAGPSDDSIKKIVKNTMIEHKMDEKSRESREENIVIHRVPESQEKEAEERKQADVDFFQDLCTEVLETGEVEVKSIIRLGKKTEDATKPRPLKIGLHSKQDKRKIMSRLGNLKDAEEKFRVISVGDDLTLEERKRVRAKVEEAKTREKNESEGGRYIFRVRGPPWEPRIVRLEKRTS